MGSDHAPTRAAERRLKFTSVRRLESRGVSGETLDAPELPASLAAIGETFTAAYAAVARMVLLGLEAAQDGRARRRATKLRGDALFPNGRSNPER
jgi:hypothetical protein